MDSETTHLRQPPVGIGEQIAGIIRAVARTAGALPKVESAADYAQRLKREADRNKEIKETRAVGSSAEGGASRGRSLVRRGAPHPERGAHEPARHGVRAWGRCGGVRNCRATVLHPCGMASAIRQLTPSFQASCSSMGVTHQLATGAGAFGLWPQLEGCARIRPPSLDRWQLEWRREPSLDAERATSIVTIGRTSEETFSPEQLADLIVKEFFQKLHED